MSLPAPFKPLAAFRQFMLYKLVPRDGGKTDKLPVNPSTLQVSDAHDPSMWIDAEAAYALVAIIGSEYGVAFVLPPTTHFSSSTSITANKMTVNGLQWLRKCVPGFMVLQ